MPAFGENLVYTSRRFKVHSLTLVPRPSRTLSPLTSDYERKSWGRGREQLDAPYWVKWPEREVLGYREVAGAGVKGKDGGRVEKVWAS
jgi:hypothetical protein